MPRHLSGTVPFIPAVICLFLSILALPSLSNAATITVTTLVDEDGTSTDGEGCSFREALKEAQSGDNIVFGVSGTIPLQDDLELYGDKNLTITGPTDQSVILDGADTYRAMRVNSSPTLIFNNLVFQHCYGEGAGGCMDLSGTVTLNNCVFRDSSAGGGGGAVASYGDQLTVNYCLFEDNDGGNSGGAFKQVGGVVALNDCVFRGNTASSGGAIDASIGASPDAQMSIRRCEFSGNSATGMGGATRFNETSVEIVNSTFSGNSAFYQAGGIYVEDTQSQVDISFCTIAENTVGGIGGGIYTQSPLRLKNSIVSDNVVTESSSAPDIYGTVEYSGTVLVSDTSDADLQPMAPIDTLIENQSALLVPLADNGGPSLTYSLHETSPALGVVGDFTTLSGEPVTTDQRGEPRPWDGSPGDLGAFEADPPEATYEPQYTGWWWQGSDYSGTGISIEDQGDRIYLAWYGYDDAGLPVWNSSLMTKTDTGYSGTFFEYTGWPLENDTPTGYAGESVGPLEIIFHTPDSASMTYSVDSVPYTKVLSRFWDGEPDPRPVHGWWWDRNFSGMGVFLEVRDGTLFGSWYHYRDDGSPRWWITLGDLPPEATSYTGPLGEYSSGQTLASPYQPPVLESGERGPVDIDIIGDNQATMQWQGRTYDLERFDFAD